MKVYVLLVFLFVLFLTGCFNNTKIDKKTDYENDISRFSGNISYLETGKMEKVKYDEIAENKVDIIEDNFENNKSMILHQGCDEYENDEFGFKIDLSKWGSDCKVVHEQFYDSESMLYDDSIILMSQPLNDFGWFEGWGEFATIHIVPKDGANNDYNEVKIAENDYYEFFYLGGNASPSFYYTYIPMEYDDFVCDGLDDIDGIYDTFGCVCGEGSSYWEQLNVSMPKNPRSVRCVAFEKIRSLFSVNYLN